MKYDIKSSIDRHMEGKTKCVLCGEVKEHKYIMAWTASCIDKVSCFKARKGGK